MAPIGSGFQTTTPGVLTYGADATRRSNSGGIAMLVDTFTDGGMERVTIDLCRSLRNKGYASTILVARSGGRSADEARGHGLAVEEFNGSRIRMAAWLGERRPSLVFAHHCYFELQQLKAAGVPVVEVLHNAYFWQIGEAYAERQRRHNVDAVVAVSDFVKDYAVRYLHVPAHKITTIPNGLDASGLSRPALHAMNERRLQTVHTPILAFVANLHPQKNHRGVVEAFARVVGAFPGAILKIAGALDGNESLRRRLEATIRTQGLQQSVELLGQVDRASLSRLLAEAHVGLLPTRLEGFSVVTLEYAYFGLPSVLSNTGAAPWLAETYGHALIASCCAIPPVRLSRWTIEGPTTPERSTGGSREIADATISILQNYAGLAEAWFRCSGTIPPVLHRFDCRPVCRCDRDHGAQKKPSDR